MSSRSIFYRTGERGTQHDCIRLFFHVWHVSNHIPLRRVLFSLNLARVQKLMVKLLPVVLLGRLLLLMLHNIFILFRVLLYLFDYL